MSARLKSHNQPHCGGTVELSVFKNNRTATPGRHGTDSLQIGGQSEVFTTDLDLMSNVSQNVAPVYNSLSVSSKAISQSPRHAGPQANATSEASLLRLEQDFDEPLFKPTQKQKGSRRKYIRGCLIIMGSIIGILLLFGLSYTFLHSAFSAQPLSSTFDGNYSTLVDANETGNIEDTDREENLQLKVQTVNSTDSFPVTFPIPDLKNRIQENFKTVFLGPTNSSDVNVSLSQSDTIQKTSAYVSVLPPVANSTVVAEAITTGTESLISRRKTEERIEKLGLGIGFIGERNESTEEGGEVGQVGGRGDGGFLPYTDVDQIHKLTLIGFSMERASRIIAKRLNLSKAEAEEGILLDSTAKIVPSEWCTTQIGHALDRNCNFTQMYRSLSGKCNNLNHPQWGMKLEQYRRILRPEFDDGISVPRKSKDQRPLPNPQYVGYKILTDRHLNDSMLTYLFPLWAEFIERDMASTVPSFGENNSAINCCERNKLLEIQHPECFPIYIAEEDQQYDKEENPATCISVVRSGAAPSCSFGAREQFNLHSAFIDGSTVYGELNGGELYDGKMLSSLQGFGEEPNRFWPKHHNFIVDQLALVNPHWKANRLFEEAKRIVIAEIQHITLNEYLPLLLGTNLAVRSGLKPVDSGYYEGYDKTIDPGISNVFISTASKFRLSMFRQGTSASSDIVKSHQFSSVSFEINPFISDFTNSSDAELLIRDFAFNRSGASDTSFPHHGNIRSTAISNQSINVNVFSFHQSLGDMAAIVIQRGRDHGIPGYPNWRKLCGLREVHNFSDLEGIWAKDDISRAQTVYSSLDDVDLYVGGLAEIHDEDSAVGPTFACLLADQFLRIRKADRFWYEGDIQLKAFTQIQLSSIRQVSLASLLCSVFSTLGAIQGQVLKHVAEDNLIQPCSNILDSTRLNFSAWREEKPIPGIQMVLADDSILT